MIHVQVHGVAEDQQLDDRRPQHHAAHPGLPEHLPELLSEDLEDSSPHGAHAIFLFKVPLRGNPLLLIVTSCIFLVGVLFWGIFISATTRNQLMAYQMGMLTSFLPAFLLSGFVFAIENMPVVIQVVSYIFPSRYFITILKGIFLKGVGFQVLWVEITLLVVYAALLFVGATRQLKKKIA